MRLSIQFSGIVLWLISHVDFGFELQRQLNSRVDVVLLSLEFFTTVVIRICVERENYFSPKKLKYNRWKKLNLRDRKKEKGNRIWSVFRAARLAVFLYSVCESEREFGKTVIRILCTFTNSSSVSLFYRVLTACTRVRLAMRKN